MPKLTITGVPPYDGEYTIAPLTLRDASTIKKISGVRAGELQEALAAGDTDVLVAMAVVTLQRNGFPDADVNALWDTDGGKVLIETTPEEKAAEDADRPPAAATSGGEQNDTAAAVAPNDPSEPSGPTGTDDGESNPETPLATGSLGSVTSADFGQPI